MLGSHSHMGMGRSAFVIWIATKPHLGWAVSWAVIQWWCDYHKFLDSSVGKESTINAEDPGSVPGLGRSTGEGKGYPLQYSWASLVAQLVKNPPAMWETWVQSLGWEDPLEKGKATHSSMLVWRIPWTLWGCKKLDMTERLSLFWLFYFVIWCCHARGFMFWGACYFIINNFPFISLFY